MGPGFMGPAVRSLRDVVAIDCEMVGVAGPGYDPRDRSTISNALCRVSIVLFSDDGSLRVGLDTWVDVQEEIVDFRTAVTGIDEQTYARKKKKVPFANARAKVLSLISRKIVVGHAVWNDFEVLSISHPWDLVRDTALYAGLRPMWRRGLMPSLQLLARHWLQEEVQLGVHDSVEDAAVALRLYKMHEEEWEGFFANLPMAHPSPVWASPWEPWELPEAWPTDGGMLEADYVNLAYDHSEMDLGRKIWDQFPGDYATKALHDFEDVQFEISARRRSHVLTLEFNRHSGNFMGRRAIGRPGRAPESVGRYRTHAF